MSTRKIDETGKVYGEFTVLSQAESYKGVRWNVRCSCGVERVVPGVKLRNGGSKSCGHDRSVTHGLRQTRLYTTWCNMKARCYRPNSTEYKYWGGRNITIHPDWLADFQNFYDWSMANGYADDLSIDRIDVDGSYEPNNCRFVDMKTQNRNKRDNAIVEIDGKEYCLAELVEMTGIKQTTLSWRYRHGWRGEKLISIASQA